MHTCPLCQNQRTHHFFEDKQREYLQCEQCSLVFVNPDQRLDAETEKAHYDLHENNPEDMGYRRFLARIADPIAERISPQSNGIDFGCGPEFYAFLNARRSRAQHGVVRSLLSPRYLCVGKAVRFHDSNRGDRTPLPPRYGVEAMVEFS